MTRYICKNGLVPRIPLFSGRPVRDTIITQDEITDLKIVLETIPENVDHVDYLLRKIG